MSNHLLKSESSGFYSIPTPYSDDIFCKNSFISTSRASFDRIQYSEHIKNIGLIDGLIDIAGQSSCKIYDCGVYMGMFSIAAGLRAEDRGVDADIHAYEANPTLCNPIRENISLYQLSAEVHNCGISEHKGELEFAHASGRMIGGTLATPTNKKTEQHFSSYTVSVDSLASVLANDDAMSIVKLDIEGSEVSAFRSIFDSPTKINNIYIVEFSPWQADVSIRAGITYGDWLRDHFDIIRLGSWPYCVEFAEVNSLKSLTKMNEIRGEHNIDLCLLPKQLKAVSSLRRQLKSS